MPILDDVKAGLGITGDYQNTTINLYIEEVKYYLSDAGVPSTVLESAAAVGAITRGVADLWNYGAGEGKLSDYFMQRAIQLKINALADTDDDSESGAG